MCSLLRCENSLSHESVNTKCTVTHIHKMDARFQHVSTDPVFKKRSKKKKLAKDSRFEEEEDVPEVSSDKYGILTSQIDQGLEADDSSYSSGEESEEEEEVEWDANLPPTYTEGETTSRRVAVTDCEWEHVKAKDLLAILKSVCPRGGSVLDVTVYQSQFGHDEEEYENKRGPRIVGAGPEAIRRYELSKLRRYFAVAVLDSEETAQVVAQNDGVEIEATSAPLNLSLVPEDVEFDPARMRDCAKEKDFSHEDYAPPAQYYVKARQRTKVECTWETDDHQRQVAFKAQDDEALEDFVAQSDADDDAVKLKRDLLLGGDRQDEEEPEEEEEGQDFFQFDFQPSLESSGVDADDEAPRRQKNNKKKNEQTKKQQPASAAAYDDEDDEDLDARDLVKAERLKNKKLRGKRKRDREHLEKRIESDFKFDAQDPRFSSRDPRFSLDPTAPAFKKTANMNKLLAKQRS